MNYDPSTTIIIDSIKDLNIKQAIDLKKNNYKYVAIHADAYPKDSELYSGYWQQKPYEIDTFIAVRSKLDELVEDIDLTMPEPERFAEIYKRICNNIVYDYPAAYPKNESEKQYSFENDFKCRDLTNGLLEGKCVCAGFADILRSALNLVGIDACYITGPIVGERKIQNKIISGYEKLPEKSYFRKILKKPIEKLKNPKLEYHAWTKVKIDNIWYNADPTWDADYIRNGLEPCNALKTDEECKSYKYYNSRT